MACPMDRYGRIWPYVPIEALCPECWQPYPEDGRVACDHHDLAKEDLPITLGGVSLLGQKVRVRYGYMVVSGILKALSEDVITIQTSDRVDRQVYRVVIESVRGPII